MVQVNFRWMIQKLKRCDFWDSHGRVRRFCGLIVVASVLLLLLVGARHSVARVHFATATLTAVLFGCLLSACALWYPRSLLGVVPSTFYLLGLYVAIIYLALTINAAEVMTSVIFSSLVLCVLDKLYIVQMETMMYTTFADLVNDYLSIDSLRVIDVDRAALHIVCVDLPVGKIESALAKWSLARSAAVRRETAGATHHYCNTSPVRKRCLRLRPRRHRTRRRNRTGFLPRRSRRYPRRQLHLTPETIEALCAPTPVWPECECVPSVSSNADISIADLLIETSISTPSVTLSPAVSDYTFERCTFLLDGLMGIGDGVVGLPPTGRPGTVPRSHADQLWMRYSSSSNAEPEYKLF